jgi:CO/xanthine dehydrogenase FAD-binding subunit
VLSGGTWLIPLLGAGEIEARTVVDLRDVGLDRIEIVGNFLHVGAAVTYAELLSNPVVLEAAPLLSRMAASITGGPQIRHQGTIGGSAVFANPASDVPAVLVALGAQLIVASASRGRRHIEADAFFRESHMTELELDEVLLGIDVPVGHTAIGYRKLKFGESSWPIVTAAAVVRPGVVSVAVGGVFVRPVLLDLRALEETAPRAIVATAADNALSHVDSPRWADELADWPYRRQVAPEIIARAVQQVHETTL